MTTAVDTNILLDLLAADSPGGALAQEALMAWREEGELIICEAVYAEVAGQFRRRSQLEGFLRDARLRLVSSSADALHLAGTGWIRYLGRRPAGLVCPQCGSLNRPLCKQCGTGLRARQHVVADFIVGAHALVHAARLLTRDRRLFPTYFPDLTLV